MSSEESNSVPQEEAPAAETQKDQLKKERLAELRKLKEQYAKGTLQCHNSYNV